HRVTTPRPRTAATPYHHHLYFPEDSQRDVDLPRPLVDQIDPDGPINDVSPLVAERLQNLAPDPVRLQRLRAASLCGRSWNRLGRKRFPFEPRRLLLDRLRLHSDDPGGHGTRDFRRDRG